MNLGSSSSRRTIEENDYFDTKEQEAIIEKFREQNDQTKTLCKRFIVLGGVIFGGIKGYFLMNQIMHPWSIEPHKSYEGQIPSLIIIMWEFLSMTLYLYAPVYIISKDFQKKRKVNLIPYIGTIFFTMTWILFVGFKFNPELIWFFLGNLAYHIVFKYAEYMSSDSERQIRELRASMYKFNKP
ncbi:uncharacterized protein LOC126320577 [Schistocerca gregaria]|uniref:uncharacterized protein LOC126320577 n=1 Tax=Schistocerca gregaria TaxID=7010 RepID=UPI00211F3C83|nr:uncharacterized protein LOC126320577 [Schistocerca gregaria]